MSFAQHSAEMAAMPSASPALQASYQQILEAVHTDRELAAKLCEETLQVARDQHADVMFVRIAQQYGFVMDHLGEAAGSINVLFEALQITHALHLFDDKPHLLQLIGRAYYTLGNYRAALQYWASCIEDSEVSGERLAWIQAKIGLGQIYDSYGDHASAVAQHTAAANELDRDQAPFLFAKAHINLGVNLVRQEEYEKAILSLEMAVQVCDQYGYTDYSSEGRYRLAEIYLIYEDYEEALDALDVAEQQAIAAHYAWGHANILGCRAEALAGLGRMDAALAVADTALLVAKRINASHLLARFNQAASRYAQALGDVRRALSSFKAAYALEYEMNHKTGADRLVELEAITGTRINAGRLLVDLSASKLLESDDPQAAYCELSRIACLVLNVRWAGVWRLDAEGTLTSICCFDAGKEATPNVAQLQRANYPAFFRWLDKAEPLIAHNALRHQYTWELADDFLNPYEVVSLLLNPIRFKATASLFLICQHAGAQRNWTPDEAFHANQLAEIGARAAASQERYRFQRELERARNHAEAANRAKSEFLANMSHEIRTPINAVMGLSHLALKTKLDSKQKDYLEKIHYSGEHLLGIIDDILDISKIDAGKLSIEETDFALADVLENLMQVLENKARDKQLKLVWQADPAIPPHLRGDPLRIRQILINYVNNAIKFTHNGEICVRASCDFISGDGEGSFLLRCEVQDSGIGISAEQQARLFQSFEQADTSTTRKYGGSGLGLAICKQLARLMGGDVGVTSQAGHGSTFWFTVRLKAGTGLPSSRETKIVDAPKALRGKRVLLAEDNVFNQQVATELLEQVGVTVVVANHGREALALLRAVIAEQQPPYDCVLMDLQMPEMDGLQATREIRADPSLAHLNVIAMTANARQEDRDLCAAAGMNDFVTKPTRAAQLYATLAKWVGEPLSLDETSGEISTDAADPAPVVEGDDSAEHDASAVIDLAILADLLGNNPKKMRKFAFQFLDSARNGLADIAAGLANNDMNTVRAAAHRIKSSARFVGAMHFSEICEALEKSSGDDVQAARQLEQQLVALVPQIEAVAQTMPLE